MIYSPFHYRENRQDLIFEIIHKYSFATLISVTNDGPIISHLPVLLDNSKKVLLSHCARANPHWQHFKDKNPVTVIFNGPHSYISPAWYKPNPDNVPTWNYITVHVQGCARIIEDSNEGWSVMNKLVQQYENQYGTGWILPSEQNNTLKDKLAQGITIFEISMDKIEAKFKLSQKQNSDDRTSVIENLTRFSDENKNNIADYMKRVLK